MPDAPSPTTRLELEGAHNFRDIGGYPTADGRRVRRGLVYRADGPHDLTEADLERLGACGLRTAIDLRSPPEREAQPSRLPHLAGLRELQVPLLSGRPPEPDPSVSGEHYLLAIYEHLLEDAAATIGGLLGELARPDALPAVFHCSAGKDRTGVLAAVLLLALGVDEATVLDDYELTSTHHSEERVQEIMARLGSRGLPPELAAGLMGTPRWVLARALDGIDGAAGVESYLLGAAGLDPDDLAALRATLLDDA